MIDFITGWILGRNSNKIKIQSEVEEDIDIDIDIDDEAIEKTLELPKVHKYAAIPEITDIGSTIEEAYNFYEKNNLVTLYKDGHIIYYTEVLVPENQVEWGMDSQLVDFI